MPKQHELYNAISRATGECSLELQRRGGFSLVDLSFAPSFVEPDHFEPQVIDFDAPFEGTTQSIFECC